jgi:hypothetical protein
MSQATGANAVSDLERAEHLGYADSKGVKRVSIFNDGVQANVATEDTLQKTVGFDVNSDITTTIATVGSVKTIIETDGAKTNTTVVDKTDVNNIQITNVWS